MSTPNDLELYKLKKLIRHLESAQGDGKSMITVIIPPAAQIAEITKMFTDEYGAASNIKSSRNGHSVQTAIRSAQAKLKLVNKLPANGLALFVGEAIIDGKRKKISEAMNRPRLSRLVCINVKINFL